MHSKPADVVFVYGSSIWDLAKRHNGVVLIDSNTMSLSNTPCINDLSADVRYALLSTINNLPVSSVEREKDADGKVITTNYTGSYVGQGSLGIKHTNYHPGDPDLLGQLKYIDPSIATGFIMYTSYHANRNGEWSATALKLALQEFFTMATVLNMANRSVFMSMPGLQYDIYETPVQVSQSSNPQHTRMTKVQRWDINKVRSGETIEGNYPDDPWLGLWPQRSKISTIIGAVAPANITVTVVV